MGQGGEAPFDAQCQEQPRRDGAALPTHLLPRKQQADARRDGRPAGDVDQGAEEAWRAQEDEPEGDDLRGKPHLAALPQLRGVCDLGDDLLRAAAVGSASGRAD